MDPYQILGLNRSATDKDIRAAYRKLAKTAHPDVGGDPNRFAALRLAHDVLLDPKRREHFDRTGEVLSEERDDTLQQAISLLTGAVASIIMQEDKPEQIDIPAKIAEMLKGARKDAVAQIAKMKAHIGRIERVKGRFTVKEADRDNIFEAALATQLRELNEGLAKTERAIAAFDMAAEMLKAFDFRRDAPDVSRLAAQAYAMRPDQRRQAFTFTQSSSTSNAYGR